MFARMRAGLTPRLLGSAGAAPTPSLRHAPAASAAEAAQPSPERWRDVLACIALTFWVFFLYRGALAVYFLDQDFTWLRHCRVGPLRAAWAVIQQYTWCPIAQLWFGLDYAVWGLHPFGYHLGILAWHALATCTLYAIGAHAFGRPLGLVAAAAFSAHPLHVEAMSWASACAEVLCSTFSLLTLFAFIRWRSGRSPAVTVFLFYALALLTLGSAAVLPLLAAGTDTLLPGNQRALRPRLRLYAGLIVTTAGFLVLRRVFGPPAMSTGLVGFDPRLAASASEVAGFLVGKARDVVAMLLTLPDAGKWLALPFALGLLSAAFVLWWYRQPLALWGVLWVGMTFAPFSLLLFGPVPRVMHLPLAGAALALAGLVLAVHRAVSRLDAHAATAAVCVALTLWLGHVSQQIGNVQADFVRRGNVVRTVLTDLLRLLPDPSPGSRLAFYGMARVHAQGALIFGLDDAVRLFYGDDSLTVQYLAADQAAAEAYAFSYYDGRLSLVGSSRK